MRSMNSELLILGQVGMLLSACAFAQSPYSRLLPQGALVVWLQLVIIGPQNIPALSSRIVWRSHRSDSSCTSDCPAESHPCARQPGPLGSDYNGNQFQIIVPDGRSMPPVLSDAQISTVTTVLWDFRAPFDIEVTNLFVSQGPHIISGRPILEKVAKAELVLAVQPAVGLWDCFESGNMLLVTANLTSLGPVRQFDERLLELVAVFYGEGKRWAIPRS